MNASSNRTEQLETHLYVLARFARLDAPEDAVEQVIRHLARVFGEAGGARRDQEEIAAQLHGILSRYAELKRPLIEEAGKLIHTALMRATTSESHLDPCHVAQRAAREGAPVQDETHFARLLALAERCDDLDNKLRRVLGAAIGLG